MPTLKNTGVKLFVVGIGTLDSAREFAKQLDLPAEIMFADEGALSYQAVKMVNSDFDEDGQRKGMRMLTGSTWESVKKRKGGRPVSFFGLFDLPMLATNDDLEAVKPGGGIYKPLMITGEKATEKSFVLGGILGFDGDGVIFKHKDKNVGTHANLQDLLDAVTG